MAKVFLTHIPEMLENYYGSGAVAALKEIAEVRLNPVNQVLGPDELALHAAGCQIVVSDRQTPGYREFFPNAPDLVAFLRVAVDIRNIDVPAASREGILVTQATPGFAASVSELAICFMIDLGRQISRSVFEYRSGREAQVQMGRQLAGSTLGILGYGTIGEYLAKLAQAFGMTVLVSDPHKTVQEEGIAQTSFENVLTQSDFVVCLVIAAPETENLMSDAAFARMKRSAYFLNLSRGNLVDESALQRALDAKLIAGAAMDVGRAHDQKPSLFLAKRPDIVATPHIGGLTPAAAEHQAFDTVEQVRALLSGQIPKGAVNLESASRLKRLIKTQGNAGA
jgi:D-3-phosphoglycerate dehydrogenase / 2-oxoglutarate reductase